MIAPAAAGCKPGLARCHRLPNCRPRLARMTHIVQEPQRVRLDDGFVRKYVMLWAGLGILLASIYGLIMS